MKEQEEKIGISSYLFFSYGLIMYATIVMQYLNAFERILPSEAVYEIENDWFIDQIKDFIYQTNELSINIVDQLDNEYISLSVDTLNKGISYLISERNSNVILSEYYLYLDKIIPVKIQDSKAIVFDSEYKDNQSLKNTINNTLKNICNNFDIRLSDINDVIMVIFIDIMKKREPIAIYNIYYPPDQNNIE